MVVERRWTVVPAVRLTWRLQVLAGAAAIPVVPFPLVDGVAVAMIRVVGQIVHVSPHEDGRATSTAREELNEMDVAVRISGPVARVGLHPAVAAYHLALLWVLYAPTPPSVERVIVLCDHRPCRLWRRSAALRVTTTRVCPLFGELGIVRLDRLDLLVVFGGLFDDCDVSVVAPADCDASQ